MSVWKFIKCEHCKREFYHTEIRYNRCERCNIKVSAKSLLEGNCFEFDFIYKFIGDHFRKSWDSLDRSIKLALIENAIMLEYYDS